MCNVHTFCEQSHDAKHARVFRFYNRKIILLLDGKIDCSQKLRLTNNTHRTCVLYSDHILLYVYSPVLQLLLLLTHWMLMVSHAVTKLDLGISLVIGWLYYQSCDHVL